MLEFRADLGPAVGLAFVTSLAFALLPWPVRYLIDGVLLSDRLELGPLGTFATATDGDKIRLALALAAAYLGLQLVAAVAAAGSFYYFARTALHMIHTLRGRMLAHLRTLRLGFHASTSTGDTIFRAMNDARAVQEVMILGVQAWILPVFQVTLMLALMLTVDWVLTVAALAVSPLLVITVRRLTGRIQRASQESRGQLSRLTALIEQTMSSIRAVQVFGSEGDERQRFDGTSRNFIAAQLRFRMAEQSLLVATMTLTGLGTALVLLTAANREGAVDLDDLGSGVVFDRVSLRYDGSASAVLHEVSLEIRRGETVALVGATGSGKTSILELIPRLHEASEGVVYVADRDVRQVTLASLRHLISLVPQEPLLFSTTIGENIGYGRRGASADEIEAAARAARAHDFIVELPDGYDTEVGDRGAKLSVGQQQRIAIARAFLKDAPLLLLDEPTSALDLRTEAELLDGLDALMEDRTVIIVAHRLSTVRSADRIYVLDGGRVAEAGAHDELMTCSDGLYRRLYEHQF
ncbi:MAG: ABC transporter ATP-binding protein [Acidimicrobiales bacterium]